MYNACTVGKSYIAVTSNIECLFLLLFNSCICKVEEGLVCLALKVSTLHGFKHFIFALAENAVTECLCHVVGMTVI